MIWFEATGDPDDANAGLSADSPAPIEPQFRSQYFRSNEQPTPKHLQESCNWR